jgi:HlyD family secretion protein
VVPKASASGWGRAGHRRAVLIGAVVVAVIVGAGVTAWAEVSGGSTGYRMATVTRATIETTLPVVGNVDPVSDAAASFQVGGQVATLTATPGEAVTAGQTLGTLDTTALSESVSSAQSALNAAEAKLVEDEENQAGAAAAAAAAASAASRTSASTTTTTTTTTPTKSGTNATVTQDQTTLTQDESTLSADQQKEGADLVQAQSACTSANTSTPAGQAACEGALQTVSADEQVVSKDQATVSKDETALGQALGAGSSGGTGTGGGATGNSGASPTQSGHALTSPSDATGNTGSASTGNNGSGNGSGGSTNTDTPEQIASDQAAIDSAEADLTNARQTLDAATLTSPIDGTIVSVDIAVGQTVSANSSTQIVTIIGTNAYEVQATLDSSQIPSVKVGQSATVEVDGVNGSIAGTVAQVGPVQSGASGFTYPVVVALPASTSGLFAGSTANVTISTGTVSNVVAVPTSALQTLATRAYVLEVSKGQLTRKVVKVGMVGSVYTQVLSGLTPGQSVVLADYAQPVPSSNTATLGGIGGFGGGGGGFFGGGGAGTFRFPRGAGGGAVNNVTGGG